MTVLTLNPSGSYTRNVRNVARAARNLVAAIFGIERRATARKRAADDEFAWFEDYARAFGLRRASAAPQGIPYAHWRANWYAPR